MRPAPAILGRMNSPHDSDEELMRRFAQGEAAAFEDLYERHERRIWRYLARAAGDPAVAEELMQEVWFSVARHARSYVPTARFTTWLYTLAHHRLIDALRARRPLASIDDFDGSDAELARALTADRDAEPLAVLQASETAVSAARALNQLPVEQRTAFLLHLDGGLGLEEIAELMGSTFETTKSRLRYARAKLRGLLSEAT